jgi:hypothetical protein
MDCRSSSMRPDCSFSQIESAFQAGQFGETLQCVTLADGDKLGRLLAAVGYSKAAVQLSASSGHMQSVGFAPTFQAVPDVDRSFQDRPFIQTRSNSS